MVRRLLVIAALLLSACFPVATTAAPTYDESLKELAEGITAETLKAKKRRIALVEFSDSKGTVSPIGRFLTDELATQLLLGGEVNVAERTVFNAALKKFRLTRIDPAHAHAVSQAAKRVQADVLVTGVYVQTPGDVRMTLKLIRPRDAHVMGAVRGTLPNAGPLAELLKEAAQRPAEKKVPEPKPAAEVPAGLGSHRNEFYELVVQSLTRQGRQARLDMSIQSRSPRDIKVLCLLQDTVLRDEKGTIWPQRIEDNREGLCTRGIELSPRETERLVLTFTAPQEAGGSPFALQLHETAPRHGARFTIEGLAIPAQASAKTR
ncbi:MAG TPA: FlgO family outer membrane protein [Nitrospira sp.]|nr:FlgO family outer membrane protein [Nitrospira sp.]